MQRLTPDHLRCNIRACPEVFYDGGEAIIVGPSALDKALAAGASLSPTEFAVSIPRDYLLDLAKKLMDEESQRPTSPSQTAEELPW